MVNQRDETVQFMLFLQFGGTKVREFRQSIGGVHPDT